MGQEMLVQARQRQEEQERLNAKILELRQELSRVIEEAKTDADNQAEECQNKIRSAMESRARTEEQYVQLQVRCCLACGMRAARVPARPLIWTPTIAGRCVLVCMARGLCRTSTRSCTRY